MKHDSRPGALDAGTCEVLLGIVSRLKPSIIGLEMMDDAKLAHIRGQIEGINKLLARKQMGDER